MLKTLIVEDEAPARMELRYLLEAHSDVIEVVGEAQTAREARQLIDALPYDVVFLDIEMPGTSGLELAQAIRSMQPSIQVVLVTAHEEYAIRAFDAAVVDYLLKPISSERLNDTIRRLAKRQEHRPDDPSPGLETLSFVPCEVDGKTLPIALDDIVFIMAEREVIYVQTLQERLPTRFTLQDLADHLPDEQFFRSHRSFIANIHQVREIIPYFNGTYLLRMKDKTHSEVVVSRSNVKRLKDLFHLS